MKSFLNSCTMNNDNKYHLNKRVHFRTATVFQDNLGSIHKNWSKKHTFWASITQTQNLQNITLQKLSYDYNYDIITRTSAYWEALINEIYKGILKNTLISFQYQENIYNLQNIISSNKSKFITFKTQLSIQS